MCAMRNVSSSGSYLRNKFFTKADAAGVCECADPYFPANEKVAGARVLQFSSHSPALASHSLLFRHSWSYRVAKRMLDLVLAIALLPFFVPICLLLMLLIKCGSKGPVFTGSFVWDKIAADFTCTSSELCSSIATSS